MDDRMTPSVEPPIEPRLLGELIEFWQNLFGVSYAPSRPLYEGAETRWNLDRLWTARLAGEMAGTTHLTVSKADPALGGLGEVGTAPALRGRGIARALCLEALGAFEHLGGGALFLGTVNPVAHRLYESLGWQDVPGSRVMVRLKEATTPLDYLESLFRGADPLRCVEGSPAERIPMIPLVVAPHPWQVLDANVPLFSTRAALQTSCMGLYPRYEALRQRGGTWHALYSGVRLVGLATAAPAEGCCRVDGFVQARFMAGWPILMRETLQGAHERGFADCVARVSPEDLERRSLFEQLGFEAGGPAEDIAHGDTRFPALLMRHRD
jgi:GNAT superfamily N-acetyltransferase